MRDLIAQLKSEGIGIFLISHDIHDVFDLADRISVMLQGKLVGTVNKSDVTKDEVLAMIIVGKKPGEVSTRGDGRAPRLTRRPCRLDPDGAAWQDGRVNPSTPAAESVGSGHRADQPG